MMSRLYWPGIAFLVAIITHLAYVLYLPRMDMRNRMDAIAAIPRGGFHVLSGEQLKLLTRTPMKHMHYGACVIEPGEGLVEMRTRLPGSYWSLTVYSDTGNVIYTLNDRHVDSDQLTVIFRRTRSDATGLPEVPRLREGKLVVPLSARRALAVLRAYEDVPGRRRAILRAFSASTCRTLPASPSPARSGS